MQSKVLKIGTRESQLAVWQATKVQELLAENGFESTLVYIKSEGDVDLKTPLYEIGVQGIFTHSLDVALLNNRIDLAVHSMKDVPTKLPEGIIQSAVLERASYKDLLVFKGDQQSLETSLGYTNGEWTDNYNDHSYLDLTFSTKPAPFTIATSSIRRKAQWLNRYPGHSVDNLRGNVNTRLRKVAESNWNGAVFAAAGLERINLRPEQSIELDWMLPAPAQGAIMVVCRQNDDLVYEACAKLNHAETAFCTSIEKAFLRTLMGGCSTPISALAQIKDSSLIFKGNLFTVDGSKCLPIEKCVPVNEAADLGEKAAHEILANGGQSITDEIQYAR